MKQNKKLLIVYLMLLFLYSIRLDAQEIWPLEKCIQYAHENNIQLKQYKLNAKLSENNLLQSRISVLPNLNGGGSHNYSFGRALDESTYEFTKDQTVQSNNLYLSSSVTLFNGFQKLNTIKQNKLNLLASMEDVEKIKNDISLNIAAAYLQILFSLELLEVAKNQLGITLQQVTRTKQLVDAGSLAKGSLLEIQAQTSAEELQVVNSQNQLDLSYLTLIQLLVLDSVGNFRIEQPEISKINEENIPYTVNSIYSEAVNIMPQIKSTKYQLQSQEKGLSIAYGARSPRLSLSGSYGSRYSDVRQQITGTEEVIIPIGQTTGGEMVITSMDRALWGDYPFFNQLNDNMTYGVAFNLSIPLFNGWQVNNSISNTKLSVLNAKYNLQNSKNQLYREIQQAYADALASLKKYKATENAVSSMEESFRYTQQRFNVGLVNSVEYNIAKNQLAKAQSDLIQAKYEYIFKINVLNFYMGKPIKI